MVFAQRPQPPEHTVPFVGGVAQKIGARPDFLARLEAAEQRDTALAASPSSATQNLSRAAAYRERYAQPPADIAWHKNSVSHAGHGRPDPSAAANRVGPSRQQRSQFGPLPSQIKLEHPSDAEGRRQRDLRPNEIRPDDRFYGRRGGLPEDRPAGGRANDAGRSNASGVRTSL